MIEKEVIMVTKRVPTEFEGVEQFIPTDFIEYNGSYIPTKFEEVEVPLLVPS